MTSIAFCAGVLPLIFGSGAGSEMRRAMGIAVFSGMLGVTFFGILLTPVFYVLLRSGRGGRSRRLARKPTGGAVTPLAAPAAGTAGDGHA
jgi:multidrug efflux pump